MDNLPHIPTHDLSAAEGEHLLWESFRAGDPGAYAAIYENYAGDLLRYGRKITANAPRIEDAIQDLFIELGRGRSNLSPTTSIRFYLYRALRNKLSRPPTGQTVLHDPIDDSLQIESMHTSPIEDLLITQEEAAAQIEALRQAIGQLSQRQQEAIHLRYYQHFDNQEIAELMGISDQSVRNLLYAALRALRDFLAIGLHYLTISML